MGYTTDFIGHIEIHPPLNHDEQQYLSAFSASRRFRRAGGVYDVPCNPAAEADPGLPQISAVADRSTGQPSGWCGWVPDLNGCCLSFDGHEKFYRATQWMRFLISHFLVPGAGASTSGEQWFRGFTFDHVAEGVVSACERDSHRLYLIEVAQNVVTERELWPGPRGWRRPPLTGTLEYEYVIDEWDARRH